MRRGRAPVTASEASDAKAPTASSNPRGLSMWGAQAKRRDESSARIPILVIYVVATIRCVAAGALTGSVRVHAATSRRSRIGGARCCSASCACRSTSATGTSSRSAAGAAGATTSRSAASAATTAAALCQRGRTDGDCCKQRKSEHFSRRHADLHVGISMGNRPRSDCSDLDKQNPFACSVRYPTKSAYDSPRTCARYCVMHTHLSKLYSGTVGGSFGWG